jgi:hypothetical protein
MTLPLSSSSDPNLCRVTLVGPAAKEQKRNLLRLKPWSGSEWRRVVIEMKIGTDRWPTWDQANVCLCAIQDMLKLTDGYLTDEVVNALTTHVDVVKYETFRGAPRN